MADLAYDGYVRIWRHNTFQSSPRLRLVMASGLRDFRTLYSFSEQKNVQIRMAFSLTMIKNLEWGLTRGDLNIYRENKKKLKSNMQENPLFSYLQGPTN